MGALSRPWANVAPIRSRPVRLAPDARAAALAAPHRLTAPAVERSAAGLAHAADGTTTGRRAMGLAPDHGLARAGSGLELDATRSAVAGWDRECPQLRRALPRQGLEVIHHDYHPIGRPGFRINTAQNGETRPRVQHATGSPGAHLNAPWVPVVQQSCPRTLLTVLGNRSRAVRPLTLSAGRGGWQQSV